MKMTSDLQPSTSSTPLSTCMMPVAAFDVPTVFLPPFTKCRRKRWLWRSLIKTAQQNSKPSFIQAQPSLVKPQAGDGRAKRAADLSKASPDRWRERRQRGDVASFDRERNGGSNGSTADRPADRPNQLSLSQEPVHTVPSPTPTPRR